MNSKDLLLPLANPLFPSSRTVGAANFCLRWFRRRLCVKLVVLNDLNLEVLLCEGIDIYHCEAAPLALTKEEYERVLPGFSTWVRYVVNSPSTRSDSFFSIQEILSRLVG